MFRHQKAWSDSEIEFLKANRPTHTRQWLAEQLGRTPEAIRHKIAELKVFKFKRRVMKRRADADTIPVGYKLCRQCGRTLPLEKFNRQASAKDGRQTRCGACSSANAIAWNREHPERHRRNFRTYVLRKKYGLSRQDFEALLESQGGHCPICLELLPAVVHVDHDHGTGRVRGLLHGWCNRKLGAFGDSPEALQRAINYLRS